MDNNNIFLRISYTSQDMQQICSDKLVDNNDINRKTIVRNHKQKSKKYLVGGGIYNRKGGTVFFSLKNMRDVEKITNNEKTFVKDCAMKYDVFIVPKSL
ncbi:hypothetical protein [Clostridium felsineum]|uniref:hypothetical protein n=1 Tax=Clostridium felsineum TaxID=36839 RepID=UPI00098C9B78|nr:hypothetical protein [Clostridium felsineum]URZ02218.1 hypothetical protein CLAUR_022150 [Clostridium felsineum]